MRQLLHRLRVRGLPANLVPLVQVLLPDQVVGRAQGPREIVALVVAIVRLVKVVIVPRVIARKVIVLKVIAPKVATVVTDVPAETVQAGIVQAAIVAPAEIGQVATGLLPNAATSRQTSKSRSSSPTASISTIRPTSWSAGCAIWIPVPAVSCVGFTTRYAGPPAHQRMNGSMSS